jgi:hypothetical protein
MRKPSESTNVLAFPPRASSRASSYPRRTLAPIPGNMTCLVLIKHYETPKALLVSDDGDEARAVWLPRSMLILEPGDRGEFIVATLPKLIAERKRLTPRAIDHRSEWGELRLRLLVEAQSLAARNRNRLRNYRSPLPYPGRNAFA